MTTGPKFDRQVIVQLDDQSIEGLRVQFKVEKTVSKSLNTATLTLYNVKPDRIEAGETRVRLIAGYDTPRLVFEGNPTDDGVEVKRTDASLITKLSCSDGLKTYRNSRVNTSIKKGASLEDAVDRIASEMDIPKGVIRIPESRDQTQGLVLHGSARKALDEIARSYDADWSIQNGKLNFVPRSETRDEGPLYSPELNNILEIGDKDKAGIRLKTLLEPDVVPGDRFKVEDTDDYDGVYKVESLTHEGDSGYETKFFTTYQATNTDNG